jgi:2-C-methyl-D-erythritol 4-phosphate cytidylyltransferase/2-C-methyl-D-erythritol 2,4-cyclodiphosphate synthase
MEPPLASHRISLVVVAAGRGTRLGGEIPKQFRDCAGRPLIAHTLQALAAAHDYFATTVVIHPDDRALYEDAIARLSPACRAALGAPALGGATRQQSVLAGLAAQVGARPDIVLIHDGARPFPTPELVARAIEAAARHDAAAPATAISDTIKAVDGEGRIIGAPERSALRAVQTPQAFGFALIFDAHRRAAAAGVSDLTDDIAVAAAAGHPTYVFPGDPDNFKVTTMRDLQIAEQRIMRETADIRVGQGFDVHVFAPGDHVWLGGVAIPHERSLSGHSDADVVLHALCDAIYGALGEGDIGAHFPPSDPQWKGAPSWRFLDHAAAQVAARGGSIAHLDVTIVCEAPKIGPYREAMRRRIAEIARVELDRVGVKATTSEGLGFTGRGEGIACMASATVRLPSRRERT